jgi:hypothetical protein
MLCRAATSEDNRQPQHNTKGSENKQKFVGHIFL